MENGKQRIHLDTVDLLSQSFDVPFYVFFADSKEEARYWKGSMFELNKNFKS
jgi:hypothetical protein